MYFTERAHTHAHTPYILQKAHAHHIFYRRGDNAQHIPMRTCAHTHRSHQSQIQRAKCVRLTFFNHCCVSGYFNHCCVSCAAVRAHTHTHTPYILQKAHAHHIFYRRGDNAQHIPMRTCTPQSSIANTACKVRAPHLLQSLLRFLCSCAEAGHMQMSGHGLTSCAAIDESRKVEYVHRQYRLQNTLHCNCNLCNER